MADFLLLNALAAEIGEERLLSMAKAYISYVEEKKSGIRPTLKTWSPAEFQEPLISPIVAPKINTF